MGAVGSRALWACVVVACAAMLSGCGGEAPTAPPATSWSAPAVWVTVTADGGDLQLTLPPWLVAFDKSYGIFANEAPPAPGAEIPVQLYAQGPDSDAQQEFGGNLVAWIELRVSGPAQGVANPGQGRPSVTQVQLPAGAAVRYARIDRVGTPLEWRFLVFAIHTPTGLAYLQIDGTPAGWAARSADFDHIALLLRTR